MGPLGRTPLAPDGDDPTGDVDPHGVGVGARDLEDEAPAVGVLDDVDGREVRRRRARVDRAGAEGPPGRGASFRHRLLRAAVARVREKGLDLFDEVARVLEAPVDGREPHEGDLVDLLEPLHHAGADLARLQLARLAGGEEPFHLVAERLEADRLDGALLAGPAEPAEELARGRTPRAARRS